MKIKIEYRYKNTDSYPYKAYAFGGADCISVKSSKISFGEAKAELMLSLEEFKNRPKDVKIQKPEEVELHRRLERQRCQHPRSAPGYMAAGKLRVGEQLILERHCAHKGEGHSRQGAKAADGERWCPL